MSKNIDLANDKLVLGGQDTCKALRQSPPLRESL